MTMKISAKNYHQHPAVSRSDLFAFHQSRRLFHAGKQGYTNLPSNMVPARKFDALTEGSATHMWLLEPEKAAEEIVIYEGRRASNSKAWLDFRGKHEAAGYTILTPYQWWLVAVMSEVVRSQAGPLLQSAQALKETPRTWTAEFPVVNTDGTEGVVELEFRALLDYLLLYDSEAWIIDIKTHGSEFSKSLRKFEYWLQDAHYSESVVQTEGLDFEQVQFKFAAVDKAICECVARKAMADSKPALNHPENLEKLREHIQPAVRAIAPAAFTIQDLSFTDRMQARERWREIAADYAQCVATGVWEDPGENDIITITGVLE